MDSVFSQKLLTTSRIFSKESRPLCYSFSAKKEYYQLVFCGNGNNYYPDLVLMNYSTDGTLLAELKVASAFFDAGQGELTKSLIQKGSSLVIGDLELSERAKGTPCDSVATIYRINQNGTIRVVQKKAYKISCAGKF